MNPGSAQQLVSVERRAIRAKFQSFEIGGGEFTQTVLDARRAPSGARGHLFSALRSSEAFRWGRWLQIATITRRNQSVTSHDLH